MQVLPLPPRVAILLALVGPLVAPAPASAQAIDQRTDSAFDVTVRDPAYVSRHPRVAIDQAHRNVDTMHGRYRPLAELLRSDGYEVVANTEAFSEATLSGIDVLVVADALGGDTEATATEPAFTPEECEAVYDWVSGGGALLLIADHWPMGNAATTLAAKFGVSLGTGFLLDPSQDAINRGDPTELLFSAGNGLLGLHAIIEGRNDDERLGRVVAFTGESVSVPPGAVALLRLSPTAGEVPTLADFRALRVSGDTAATRANVARAASRWPARGKALAVTLRVGAGRVVVNGDAAMFSAQVIATRTEGATEETVSRFGMNAPGTFDRQYALNVLHWLSGLLPAAGSSVAASDQPSMSPAARADLARDLRWLIHSRYDADASELPEVIGRTMADTVVVVKEDGSISTLSREDIVAHPDELFPRMPPETHFLQFIRDVTVQPYGDVAVVHYRLDSRMEFDHQPVQKEERITEAFHREAGKWKTIAYQKAAIPGEMVPARVDPSVYDDYVGRYRLYPGYVFTVVREGDRLELDSPTGDPVQLLPETESSYVVKGTVHRIIFVRDADGRVTRFRMREVPGVEYNAIRVP